MVIKHVILPFFLVAQKTFIPDYNFEQVLINLDLDDEFDDSVLLQILNSFDIIYSK